MLFLPFDGSDFQFIAAMDKHTGKTIWKTPRSIDFQDLTNGKPLNDGDMRKAFSTPRIADFGQGPLLISEGSKCIYTYDPDDRQRAMGASNIVSRPFRQRHAAHRQGPNLLLHRPPAAGDLGSEARRTWRARRFDDRLEIQESRPHPLLADPRG